MCHSSASFTMGDNGALARSAQRPIMERHARIIDRYVIREIIPPFLLALLVFTFILIIPFIIDLAEQMIAKGVPVGTLLQLMVTLLPQALALTIPMALLIGILVGLGRLVGRSRIRRDDGVRRQPVPAAAADPGVLGVVCWGRHVVGDARRRCPTRNQTLPRDHAPRLRWTAPRARCGRASSSRTSPTSSSTCSEVPTSGSGWHDVLAADTSNPSQPIIYPGQARPHGGRSRRRGPSRWCWRTARATRTKLDDPAAYEVLKFEQHDRVAQSRERVPAHRSGPRRPRAVDRGAAAPAPRRCEAQGISPHNPIMEIHKKFSIPVACFVFALLGLALGASNRKDGKLAAFVLGIARDLRLLRDHVHGGEALTKGHLGAGVAVDVAAEHRPRRGRRRPAGLARAVGRSADSHLAAALAHALASRRRRRGRQSGASAARRGTPQRPVVVVLRVPQFDLPASDAARRLHREAVPAHPGHDHGRHARACSTSRPSSTCRTSCSRARPRSACSPSSCSGRRRSSCPTSSRSPCCSRRS